MTDHDLPATVMASSPYTDPDHNQDHLVPVLLV